MLIASCESGDLATMNNLAKGPPLSRQEVLLLVDLIQEHSIIMSKQTNAGCNRLKEKAWQMVSEQFNAKISSCPRRPYQLKLKWHNLKKSARRKAIKHQAEGYYIPTDDVLDTVLKLLESTSDSGDSNSSSSNNDERSQDRTAQGEAMEGKHGANLMRHFQHKHKEEYKNVIEKNRQRKLLLAADPQTSNLTVLKNMLKVIKETSLGDDEVMETVSINDDDEISEVHESAGEEEVEANRVPAAADPLHNARASSGRSSASDSDSEYEVPVLSEALKQRSRVRRRRRSDVVRMNIAIAEYYEAKKMKVHLEIKKLQLEIDMRMNNRSDTTNAVTNNDTNIKTENM